MIFVMVCFSLMESRKLTHADALSNEPSSTVTNIDFIEFCITHWGRNKIPIVFATFSIPFSWIKLHDFWLKFYSSLLPRGQITISQRWFKNSNAWLVCSHKLTWSRWVNKREFRLRESINSSLQECACVPLINMDYHYFSITGYGIVGFAGVWSCVHDHTCWWWERIVPTTAIKCITFGN